MTSRTRLFIATALASVLLIREHGFTGGQAAQVWNLSDGCGGDSHMHN